MKSSESAGGVIINNQGLVVIVSQHGRVWSLPKGHIEENEDILTAARREILEETGISELEYIKKLGTYTRYKIGKDGDEDKSIKKTITLFLFKSNQQKLAPQDPKHPEARWVTPEEAARLLTHTKDKEFFLSKLPEIKQANPQKEE